MKIRTSRIPLEGQHSVDAFLREGRSVGEISDDFLLEEDSPHRASCTNTRADRSRICRILLEHNQAIGNAGASPAIEALQDERTVVVVTGQQPSIYGGALMIAVKLAAAVSLSRDLEQRWKVPVVPMFWNHSGDHDLAEVNSFHRLQGTDLIKEVLPVPETGVPMDAVRMEADILGAAIRLGETQQIPSHLWPTDGEPWSHWVSRNIQSWFGTTPIVHAEPAMFRGELQSLFSTLLARTEELSGFIRDRSRRLQAHGFSDQVDTTDPALLCVIDQDGRRRRLRLKKKGVLATTDDVTYTLDELTRIANDEPHLLSSAVFARPMVQQFLFPIAVQVNGPGETGYFAQLEPLYDALNLPRPYFHLRPNVTMLREKEQQIARSLKLDVDGLLAPVETWPAPPSSNESLVPKVVHDARGDTEQSLAVVKDWAGSELSGLTDSWSDRAIDSFDKTVEAILKRKDGAARKARKQFSHLKHWVWPKDTLQERIHSPWTLLRGKPEALTGQLLQEMNPWERAHQVLLLDGSDLEQEISS